MSYIEHPREPMTRSQKFLVIESIVLMIPVLLDVVGVIDLGAFKIAPFMILLVSAPTLAVRSRKESCE